MHFRVFVRFIIETSFSRWRQHALTLKSVSGPKERKEVVKAKVEIEAWKSEDGGWSKKENIIIIITHTHA